MGRHPGYRQRGAEQIPVADRVRAHAIFQCYVHDSYRPGDLRPALAARPSASNGGVAPHRRVRDEIHGLRHASASTALVGMSSSVTCVSCGARTIAASISWPVACRAPVFPSRENDSGQDNERDLSPPRSAWCVKRNPRRSCSRTSLASPPQKFSDYRAALIADLTRSGYTVAWQVLNACNFGVPQLRPRFILVAIPRQGRDPLRVAATGTHTAHRRRDTH